VRAEVPPAYGNGSHTAVVSGRNDSPIVTLAASVRKAAIATPRHIRARDQNIQST